MGSFGACLLSKCYPLRLSIRQPSRDFSKVRVLRILSVDRDAPKSPRRAPQQKGMNRVASIWLGLLAIALLPALAQTSTGRIHGHVTNPTGASQQGGTVTFVGRGISGAAAEFSVDTRGNYSAEVPAGNYKIVYRTVGTPHNKESDRIENVQVMAGQDVLQDIDMSRQEYIDTLTAEQRSQLEELKNRNSEAMRSNEIIKALNEDLRTCAQDIKDVDSATDSATKVAKYLEIETLMLRDSQAKPDASVLWAFLGQAQVGLMKYHEAESSFTKALECESTSKRPNPQIQSLANSGLAQIHAKLGGLGGTNATQPVSNQPAMTSATPSPAQHKYEDLAAPQPPPAPAPTISMGQSKDQVIAAFGDPQRKAAVGLKEIFFYTDLKMKVTFTNGKVSSIE